jgi:8-oxo-dGTP pyrophosphatase MutT (NUDIX family)
MKIETVELSAALGRLGPDYLGFDVEMANSFRDAPPVICMMGIEHFDPRAAKCISTIATITRRDDEPELIRWFLDTLHQFSERHSAPKLLTFSGTDNDLPWVRERVERFGIPDPPARVLDTIEHIDLKLAFYARTQHNNISLKKLEERFGIQREAQLTSKKVSYLLTDIVRRGDPDPIPARIHGYLREDVHHLLVIYDRWSEVPLEHLSLSESDYVAQVASLIRLARKLGTQPASRVGGSAERDRLREFTETLERRLDEGLMEGTLERFKLPPPPPLGARHPDVERLLKKHANLGQIEISDPSSGAYRLARELDKPKGILVAVRREGRVLMIRRADSLKRAPGLWGLPGGVLEPGEPPRQGAVRELKEELNLEGRAVQVLGAAPSYNKQYELYWVEVAVDDVSRLKPNPDEVAEVRWVAPHELTALHPLIGGAVEGFQRFLGSEWGRKPRATRSAKTRQ